MKPDYITMTRRQSNNQWSDGIAAHPAQKFQSAKIRWKSSRFDFLGSRCHPPHWFIFHRAKLSTQSITHLCWCSWRTFWRRNTAGSSPSGLVHARQFPGSPGTCNPEESGLPGLPKSWSPTPFSGSGPIGIPPVPWTEKTIARLPFFIWCRDLVGQTTFWIFFEWLAKVRAMS